MKANAVTPQARALQIVQSIAAGKLIATLTEAGIPDVLAEGPCDAGDIARAVGFDPDALKRALRAAEALGIFARTSEGTWENTDIGHVLRSEVRGSVRDYVVYALHDGNWRAWRHLIETLRTGKPSFPKANDGVDFWQYLDLHPDVAIAFHRGMAAMAAMNADALADAMDLERFTCVADIGGGSGVLLATLLASAPKLKGILYDRAEAIDAARANFARTGVSERVRLEVGDLFDRIPDGADAYVLKNILHDHDDASCRKLLDLMRATIPESARLFVVEAVLPETAAPHPAIWRDLHMMVALGGRERTEAQWRPLLDRNGFAIERIVALPGPDAMIELRPRSRRR